MLGIQDLPTVIVVSEQAHPESYKLSHNKKAHLIILGGWGTLSSIVFGGC